MLQKGKLIILQFPEKQEKLAVLKGFVARITNEIKFANFNSKS